MIGSKADSIELSDAEKPPTAHIARVEMTVDGKKVEIFRRSVPYGTAEEHRLYFLAFSAERSRYDLMLARMFGDAPDGLRDRLTDSPSPSGARIYFAPSLDCVSGGRRTRVTRALIAGSDKSTRCPAERRRAGDAPSAVSVHQPRCSRRPLAILRCTFDDPGPRACATRERPRAGEARPPNM